MKVPFGSGSLDSISMVLTLVGVIRLSLGPARMTEDLYPLRQILE